MSPIAIDCRMIRHSGIGIYLQRLLPGVLAELEDHRIILLGDPALLSGFHSTNVDIRPYRLGIYSMGHHRALPKLLGGKADLLWTPHFNAPATREIRQVATVHDVLHLARPEFFRGRLKRLVAKWWYRQTINGAQRIIAISDFTASEISRFFPGVQSKVSVIKNFVEPGYAEFQPVRLPLSGRFFLTVGNIKPHKNVSLLLRAFELVKDKIDADLVVVGQAEGFLTGDSAVKRALERSGSRIHFPGFVEQDLLKTLYTGALCAVFPSFYEGFGLGHLEAMTLGCPVVASDIPTTGEVCGTAALPFDPRNVQDLADKLVQIATDQALRERLRGEGSERAKLFSADESIAATADLLRSLVN